MKHFVLGQGLFLKQKHGRVFYNTLYKNIYNLFNGYQLNIQIPQGSMKVTCSLREAMHEITE